MPRPSRPDRHRRPAPRPAADRHRRPPVDRHRRPAPDPPVWAQRFRKVRFPADRSEPLSPT